MKNLIVFICIMFCLNTYSQPEDIDKRLFDRIACYCYHDNNIHVISVNYNVLDKNIHSFETVVIKSQTQTSWKTSSDPIFESEIWGSCGNRISIHQAWNDNSLTNKRVTSPIKAYGADCQFIMLDSIYAVFTTVLYQKEYRNNIENYYPYPMAFLFKYDYKTKYWNKIQYKTFSYRPHEVLVVKEINKEQYLVYDSKESCSILIKNNKIEIINN